MLKCTGGLNEIAQEVRNDHSDTFSAPPDDEVAVRSPLVGEFLGWRNTLFMTNTLSVFETKDNVFRCDDSFLSVSVVMLPDSWKQTAVPRIGSSDPRKI